MLAVFHKSLAEGPAELRAPAGERQLQRTTSRLSGGDVLQMFLANHPASVLLQFNDQHAMAYSDSTTGRKVCHFQRQFAVSDHVYCSFTGMLHNLSMLRHRYGLQKTGVEVDLIIEAYKVMRDRCPYSADQVLSEMDGSFAFVLYDFKHKRMFVANDCEGKVELFWGKTQDDDVLAFSDDAEVVRAGCGRSFAPFPKGCFYSSWEGLHSFQHPNKPLKPLQHVNSQGEMCGATFRVASKGDMSSKGGELEASSSTVKRVDSDKDWAAPISIQ